MANNLMSSSIATLYDVGGQAYAAWNDNGLAMLARWDSKAQCWTDAALIGEASFPGEPT